MVFGLLCFPSTSIYCQINTTTENHLIISHHQTGRSYVIKPGQLLTYKLKDDNKKYNDILVAVGTETLQFKNAKIPISQLSRIRMKVRKTVASKVLGSLLIATGAFFVINAFGSDFPGVLLVFGGLPTAGGIAVLSSLKTFNFELQTYPNTEKQDLVRWRIKVVIEK